MSNRARPTHEYDALQVPRRFQIIERVKILQSLLGSNAGDGATYSQYAAVVLAIESMIKSLTQPTKENKNVTSKQRKFVDVGNKLA